MNLTHNMDLRSLQHAIALADTGHFSRAAEQVHLTQSAMSRSIQALEREAGMPLFDRTAQGVVPTATGRQFLQRARRLVHDARNLRHEMDWLRLGEYGEVKFGVGPGPAVLLPELLTDLTQQHPKLRVGVEINNWEVLAASLRRETIEFFIANRHYLEDQSGLAFTPLGSVYKGGGFFCRTGHPLTRHTHPDLADLTAYPLLGTRMPESVRQALQNALDQGANGPSPLSVTCDNIFLLKLLMQRSDAILYTSRALVHGELQDGVAVQLPIPNPYVDDSNTWEVSMVTLAGRSLSPAALAIVEAIKSMYAREAGV